MTRDEIYDLGSLRMQMKLNGTTMQNPPVADLIFDVVALIAYLSA